MTRTHRFSVLRLAAAPAFAALVALGGCAVHVPPIDGMVWQPDNATALPRGTWDKLGATRLLVQWTAVDGQAFVPDAGMDAAASQPDWDRIAAEPWAKEVILGLAGRFDEKAARSDIEGLANASVRLAALKTPLRVVGYYFPVEIDPTWAEAPRLAALLNRLPRPLWISVYDSANVGPEELARGLAGWLPADVGVFFQDGVGVHAREARIARVYANALSRHLGPNRVRIIAEAFRPQVGGGFRPASFDELAPQLARYEGYPVYLFEGPRYVSSQLVDRLVDAQKTR